MGRDGGGKGWAQTTTGRMGALSVAVRIVTWGRRGAYKSPIDRIPVSRDGCCR